MLFQEHLLETTPFKLRGGALEKLCCHSNAMAPGVPKDTLLLKANLQKENAVLWGNAVPCSSALGC